MPQTKTGDSVKLSRPGGSLRLDRPDAEALQAIVYEAQARAQGALVGLGSGMLTTPSVDASDLSAVEIGDCALFWAYAAGGGSMRNPEGTVLRHDPSLTGQSSTIDISAYEAGEGTPWIWAARVEIETTAAGRKKWATPGGEVGDNTESRYEERVVWAVGDTNPDVAAGYFAVGRIYWDGGPWFRWRSPFDPAADDMLDDGKTTARNMIPAINGGSNAVSSMGVATLLRAILADLAMMQDRDWSVNLLGTVLASGSLPWFGRPTRGLKQLDEDLATAEVTIAPLVQGLLPIAAGRFLKTGKYAGELDRLVTAAGVSASVEVVTIAAVSLETKAWVRLTFTGYVTQLQVTPTHNPETPSDIDSDSQLFTSTRESRYLAAEPFEGAWQVVTIGLAGQFLVSHPVYDAGETTFAVYFATGVGTSGAPTLLQSFYFSAIGYTPGVVP